MPLNIATVAAFILGILTIIAIARIYGELVKIRKLLEGLINKR